jgi:hypothetical protein
VSEDRALSATEDWFVAHGLPYFVEDLRAQAERGLARRVFLPVVLGAVVLGIVVGVFVGILVGTLTAGAVLTIYGFARLQVAPMARWAVAHTFSSLGLLFPLVTRALPLLLLFVTFLFINTEVWQVATSLDGGVLWAAVLLFAGVAVGFLLVRLPEELDRVDDEIGGERLVAACKGTPLEAEVARYAEVDVAEVAQVRGYAKGNLVFVLLVSQTVQVLLLALSVYVFFVIFGSVAIKEPVMTSWLGVEPRWVFDGWNVLSFELLQVSTFLAAFSGLYFTVYAVSDENYRKQFFDSLVTELERAVAVRAVYRLLRT